MSKKYIIKVTYYEDYDTTKCWYMKDEKNRILCGMEQVKNSHFCSNHQSEYHTNDCMICTDEFTVYDKALEPCGHWVHLECVYKSGKDICPICRTKLNLTKKQQSYIKEVHYDEAPGMAPTQNDIEDVFMEVTLPPMIFNSMFRNM